MEGQKRREERERMLAEQLVARGIKDQRVLAAMAAVPRERFVTERELEHAYDDRPLPIGFGQTISQPYIVARMLELANVREGDRLLEIGAGSGYALAVAARLCSPGEALGVEIVPELAARASAALAAAGVDNARVICGDGTLGSGRKGAGFDVILVSAGAPTVPALLAAELADGGRMVLPVGERESQRLMVIERHGDEMSASWGTAVRFVDLRGRYGWREGGLPEA